MIKLVILILALLAATKLSIVSQVRVSKIHVNIPSKCQNFKIGFIQQILE